MLKQRFSIVTLAAFFSCSIALAAERTEISFPDIEGYQTLKCDFHMHTVFSDGRVWPTIRVDEAWRQGLDAIAISDHIEYQPHKNDLPTNHKRPFELCEEHARQKNILLIQAAEITRHTPPGHYNALFLNDIDALVSDDFYKIHDAAQEQNAFVFWNHPQWKGEKNGQWEEYQQTIYDKGQLKGIEVANGQTYYPIAHQMALDHDLTMLGDSDEHYPFPTAPWTAEEHRTMNLVFAKERTTEGIREALLAKRTVAWLKNQLIGREEYLKPLFEKCVEVKKPHHTAGDKLYVEIVNNCELDITLKRVGKGHPKKITLPAKSTQLVKFPGKVRELDGKIPYKTENFLTAPDTPLQVELTIPELPKSAVE